MCIQFKVPCGKENFPNNEIKYWVGFDRIRIWCDVVANSFVEFDS